MTKKRSNINLNLTNSGTKTILLTVFSVFTILNSYSQKLIQVIPSERPDFCSADILDSDSIIGRQVKIWDDGGVYEDLNKGNTYQFPTEEIRRKSGKNYWKWRMYRPKEGYIGTVVHIFRNEKQSHFNIYLIKVGNNYVPIDCTSLTEPHLLTDKEETQQYYIQVANENVLYAKGCKFKISNQNRSWSRAGIMNIDRVSEIYACNLISEGIDTVLLAKYIFDNGSLPREKAFVLWIDKGQGYLKAFFNNSQHAPTENEVVLFDTKCLINHFFENRIYAVKKKPKVQRQFSHSMGYSVQLYTPNYFFRERLRDDFLNQDTEHPKIIWWNLISDKLGNIQQE